MPLGAHAMDRSSSTARESTARDRLASLVVHARAGDGASLAEHLARDADLELLERRGDALALLVHAPSARALQARHDSLLARPDVASVAVVFSADASDPGDAP